MCFLIKLGRHVNHGERIYPIDFEGQRSKVKVTMDIYGDKLVNTIETKPLCISSSNLANMLSKVNSIDFRGYSSKVKVTMVIIDKCGVRGDATLCVGIFSFDVKCPNVNTHAHILTIVKNVFSKFAFAILALL